MSDWYKPLPGFRNPTDPADELTRYQYSQPTTFALKTKLADLEWTAKLIKAKLKSWEPKPERDSVVFLLFKWAIVTWLIVFFGLCASDVLFGVAPKWFKEFTKLSVPRIYE